MEKLKLKENKLKVLEPRYSYSNVSTVIKFDQVFENEKIQVIRGINPNFIYCNMPLEIIIDYKDKRLFYNLVLEDFDSQSVDAVHGIVNLPSSLMGVEDAIREIFENEKFDNGESLLDYILENNFILFESTGSYPIDESYLTELKHLYNFF